MKWFYNMKIKAKMLLSFFIIIALMIGLSVLAIVVLDAVDGENDYALEYAVKRETSMLRLQVNMRDFRRVVASITMYAPLDDAVITKTYISDANAYYEGCLKALDSYENYVRTDPKFTPAEIDERVQKADNVRESIVQYKNVIFGTVAEHALKGDHKSAVEAVIAGAGIIAEMTDTVGKLTETAVETAAKAQADATDMARQASVMIVVIAIVAALIAIVVALYVAKILSKPLILLSDFMKKAGSTGDLALTEDDIASIRTYSDNKDEMGQTIGNTAAFVKHITQVSQELQSIAGGDLTAGVDILSEEDVIGNSMKCMVGNLNEMFEEINNATVHVSSVAKQIADGSQSLAQGSTQQAAAVEELSSSITEIAQKTKDNASMAVNAASLADNIKTKAEMGNSQMNEMMSAVKDINEASHSISRVIKVIDDIAFQTNILALNAAIEAARAGPHGKGFAVVAEEVRNLAAKSAEAAKNTEKLIQNTIEKAEFGTNIADQTAASLSEIVQGINESNRLVEEIARLSEEQSLGITQINTGIDQVAQVVQQNSATAEQSASASAEMSGQSDTLHQLIARFRLKDKADGLINDLLAEKPAQKKLSAPRIPAHSTAGVGGFGKY